MKFMKSMKLKKLIAILSVSVMSVTVLAACGKKDDTPTSGKTTTESSTSEKTTETSTAEVPAEVKGIVGAGSGHVFSPDNPITISLWVVSQEAAPAPDNKLTKLMQDELGVTLEMEITMPDNQETRIGTMLAGGEYPDIIAQAEQKAAMIAGHSMIKLDDYLASGKWPLLKEHVDPVMSKLIYRGGEAEEGFYIFPNYNRWYGAPLGGEHWGAGFWIQKAVLEDAGYPDLSHMSLDRYFELIDNYMAKYPEINGVKTIGFEPKMYSGHEWGLTNPPALLAGSPNNGGVIVDDSLKASIYANSEYAYRYYKKLNEEYLKGSVDTEGFVQTQDQYHAKLASGAVLGMHDQRWAFGPAQDALVAEERYDRTYVALMPTFDDIAPYYMDVDVMNVQQGMGISVDCENPELILDFLEIMIGERWQKLLFWGIEGEDYFVNNEGFYERTQQMRDDQNDPIWRSSNQLRAFRDQLPKHQGLWPDGNPDSAATSKIEFFENLKEYDRNFLSNYNRMTWKEFLNTPPPNPAYYPAWQAELSDAGKIADTQLRDISLVYLPQAIMAKEGQFNSVWEKYLAEIDQVDTATYLADVQKHIDYYGK